MGFLYFAYGSNLLSYRLLHAHDILKTRKGIGKLEDFKLVFTGFRSKTWGGHPATIEKTPGATVWGVVWEIDDAARPLLDKQESKYCPINFPVDMSTGGTVECLTYEMKPDVRNDESGLPSPFYLDVLQRGARQNCLPLAYRDWLDKHPHNSTSSPVPPLYREIIKQIQDDHTCNQNLEKLIS